MEQIGRVLNEWTAAWLRRRCGVGDKARTGSTVRYHQARNAAARKSRIRQRKRRLKELLAL
jgi:hypothetical protein